MWPVWSENIEINAQTIVHKILKLCLNSILSWWFLFSLYFWTRKNILWPRTFTTLALSRLFKCGLCDHGTTQQKHLLSTHMRIGTRFKCNQCDQIANQWRNLKSHKQRTASNINVTSVITNHWKEVTLQNKTRRRDISKD